ERARLDAGERDQLDARRQDARDLDQVDVADAGDQEGVVEGVEWGRSFGVAGGAGGLRHGCEVHSVSPPCWLSAASVRWVSDERRPIAARREFLAHRSGSAPERKRKVV